MIIEKKNPLPKAESITVPCNYVLIKMDDALNSYQFKGKETGITASPIIYDNDKQVRVDERLVSPFGTVIKRPERLVYNGRLIKEMTRKYEPIRLTGGIDAYGEREKVIVNPSALREIGELKQSSVSYDTDLEIENGDRVHVSYIHYLNAGKQGLFIDTQEGDMVLVKYDLLRMVVDGNNQPKRMLNGYMLIEPEALDIEVEQEDGVEFTQRESGLVMINPTKIKKTRKKQIVRVLVGGTPLRGYLEEPNKVDTKKTYKEGDRLLIDPRFSLKLENDVHQIISEKDLYVIRREAIIFDEEEFDIDRVEI